MQMQTGPAQGQGMRSWLAWTGTLEIINIFIFAGLVWLVVRDWERPARYTWLGLAILGLILLEGGGYWLAKRSRAGQPWSPHQRLRLLRVLYRGTAVLLLVYPLAVVAGFIFRSVAPAPGDLLFGGALYLFGVGEYIHYFIVKINMRPREWRAIWRQGRLPPARLRRELQRAEVAARRGASPSSPSSNLRGTI